MVKAYIGEPLRDVLPFPVLNRHLGKEPYKGKKAYRANFEEKNNSFIELTQTPEDAHFFLVPHNYFSIKDEKYINHFMQTAEKHGKRVFMFAFGDREAEIDIKNATILRYSGYRYKGLKPHETIIPTQIYAGDILEDKLFFLRDKEEMPTISFCGWAGFSSWRERFGHLRRIAPLDFKKYILLDKNADVHKQGIYFRKKAIKALANSSRVRTSFLIRNFYVANKNTVQGDPALLRKEYIENMRHSDLALIARGDSNMAVRFYEALALGRIPVLIDTDWILPLEDIIDYKKFVIFVPHQDIKNIDVYIHEFWDTLSNNQFHELQKEMRETFMNYLKFDSFLKHLLHNV